MLDLEETGVIRSHARDQINDTQLAETLEQIGDERATLKGHLAQLDAWDTQHRASPARLSQLDHLAHQATKNLSDATPQDQRRVYELLTLRIDVAAERSLQVSGTIPTHGPLTLETGGDVSTQGLQHLTLLQRGVYLVTAGRPGGVVPRPPETAEDDPDLQFQPMGRSVVRLY